MIDSGHISDKQLEYFTMKGLPFLQSLISATTREDLTTLLGPDPRLSRTDTKLSSLIRDTIRMYNIDRIVDFEQNVVAQRMMQKPLIRDDRDGGPEAIWTWAHLDDPRRNWLPYESQHARLRREGYLLWDRARCNDVWLREPFRGLAGGSASEHEDVPLHGWFLGKRLKDEDRLELSRGRLGLLDVLPPDDVIAMVEQNVLEHGRYNMAIKLSPAS
jgi:hypothetical protein